MRKLLGVLTLLLILNSAYIAAFAFPTIFYMGNVLLHVVLGIVTAALFGWYITKHREFYRANGLGVALLAVATVLGVWLTFSGATTANRWGVILHAIFAAIGLAAMLPYLWPSRFARALTTLLALLVVLPLGAAAYYHWRPNPSDHIQNPLTVPTSMAEEGGGPKSPFWPSASNTNTNAIIPANFFMDSKACGECHRDIYNQWNSSVHHFASFNNQFYRKSIEYMQDVSGVQGSKWCAGCHDHAVFFNGRFERPIKEQIDTPEAQNGLGCMSCHSIVHVDSTMGNGGFTIEYPPLHELASSKNPYIHALDHFLTYLNPEPHRRTFMKPFMRQEASEFCSTCHKVHLDVPVNNYRWQRGFNDYDNWQASAVSGQGARSFYYPPKASTCADCHMPLTPSNDPGNHDGKVHSHRFPAANVAVAYVNQDKEQLAEEEKFLRSGFITVDIFAASPVEKSSELQMRRRSGSEGPQLQSTFAVGEEAEQSGPVFLREVGKVAAPIDTSGATFQAGSTVRIDTVVRTRKVGHFFPGGTVDSFDVWLELQARDADGRTIFWSGSVEDNGRGQVERGAHFYRSYLLDADGNEINKRNAWAARSVLYVRLIPPGAADVAHYRIHIPQNARGPISVTARLNYRKFSHYYTQFAYAGQAANQPNLVTLHYDNRPFSFLPANIPANVSGMFKDAIPDLPIVTLATAETKLPLGGNPAWTPVVRKQDRERWNDWGIGLLLQGDLKGAEYAFKKVTEAEPGYADGWLNVARALIQEGETDAAKPYIDKALALNTSLGRTWFFHAMIQKADGDYDGALASLRRVESQYPRDRVVQNQIGRILFLKRDYSGAVKALQACLAVDAEDVQAHYNLMLAYRGLGQSGAAEREQKLFLRFKADESAQSITAKPRLASPEANNERQPIHDHESAIAIP
ncbi:MAG: tetratricopeptide repeat protein [Acidobacteriota bacterium]|nr:tetratricopeptide repeat protein [Acidobacteriota bacterium]